MVRWPSGKASVCKTDIRGFDSRPHLFFYLFRRQKVTKNSRLRLQKFTKVGNFTNSLSAQTGKIAFLFLRTFDSTLGRNPTTKYPKNL